MVDDVDTEEGSARPDGAVCGPAPDGTDDRRLTTVGLLFESSTGLRRRFQQRLDADGSRTNLAFDVLIRLARTPGHELRMSELAAETALTPSGLTRAVDRLQDQGLVDRRTCPEDRRGSFALLTPAGVAFMARIIPAHLADIDQVLEAVFTPEEEDQLASLLRRLRDHLLGEGCAAAEDGDGACPLTD
jgi:DNA-binding MarR family transcriptional regulator